MCDILRQPSFTRRLSVGMVVLFFVTVSHAFWESSPTVVRAFSLPEKGEMNPPVVAAYRAMERFLELHLGIGLEASTKLPIEGAVVDAAPSMAITSGTSPGVMAVNLRWPDTCIRERFLYSLDEYIAPIELKGPGGKQTAGRPLLIGFYILLVCCAF